MGSFVPLIGSLKGKIGAMVIDKTSRVRLHAPGANRTPVGVKNAFTMLARSWPFSTVEYKTLIQEAPGSGRGIGYLTGRAYRAYELAPETPPIATVDTAGICPYRLSNLAGTFGEMQTLSPFTPTAVLSGSGLAITFTFTAIPTVEADSWKMCVLIAPGPNILSGEVDAATAGAVFLTASVVGDAVHSDDDRYIAGTATQNLVWFAALTALDSTTSKRVCHGFASGVVADTET